MSVLQPTERSLKQKLGLHGKAYFAAIRNSLMALQFGSVDFDAGRHLSYTKDCRKGFGPSALAIAIGKSRGQTCSRTSILAVCAQPGVCHHDRVAQGR